MDFYKSKKILLSIAVIIITAVFDMALNAGTVFLKDGTRINGTIVSDSETSLAIRTDDNRFKEIPRDHITKILYQKPETEAKNMKPEKTDFIQSYTIFEFNSGIIIPLGKFGEMADTGYGGMLSITKRDFLFDGLETGAGIGFHYLPGKGLLENGKLQYNRFAVTSMLFNAGYRLRIVKDFYLIPVLSPGAAFINMAYIRKDSVTGEEVRKSVSSFDPVCRCRFELEYIINQSVSISINGEYGAFIEMSGVMPFAAAGIALQYRL